MSGINNSLTSDYCFIKEETKQSVKPGNMNLYYGYTVNDKLCNFINGPRSNNVHTNPETQRAESFGEKTDIDSELTNRVLSTSRCQKNRTLKEKNARLSKAKLIQTKICHDLDTTYSILEYPKETYRGLSTIGLQIDFPLTNPTKDVFYGNLSTIYNENKDINTRGGIWTPMESKDAFSKNLISIHSVPINLKRNDHLNNDIFCDTKYYNKNPLEKYNPKICNTTDIGYNLSSFDNNSKINYTKYTPENS